MMDQAAALRLALYRDSVDPGLAADDLKDLIALEENQEPDRADRAAAPVTQFLGGMLGSSSEIKVQLHHETIPTGIYHLLNPTSEPLLTVTLTSREKSAVRVRVRIPGFSAWVSATISDPRDGAARSFLPPLLPGVVAKVQEPQRASIRVVVDTLGKEAQILFDHSYPVAFLSRNSSFNSVQGRDLTRYYGAWVTPYVREVQELIRAANSLSPRRASGPVMVGYQGDDLQKTVPAQVRALYGALQKADVTYVNSIIDYGMPPGFLTQRTRLPRESLRYKSANCIDGTVLFASLLEGSSLNPGIVLVPGHAFLAWQNDRKRPKEWSFLETTLVGKKSFEEAVSSANSQMEGRSLSVQIHPLDSLRADGIWPME